MTTLTISEDGAISLPDDVLQEKEFSPGAQVVMLKSKGRVTFVARERFEQLVEQPLQEWMAELGRSLAEHPERPYFGGLSIEEYGSLSEEEDKALWDRLGKEAEQQVKSGERDVPAHYRPAGQERR